MVQKKVLIDLLLDAEIVCVSRDLNGADHIIDICDSPFIIHPALTIYFILNRIGGRRMFYMGKTFNLLFAQLNYVSFYFYFIFRALYFHICRR